MNSILTREIDSLLFVQTVFRAIDVLSPKV